MGRVINTNGPGKRRNQLMRTVAEVLRRMSQKTEIDDEAKDMAALMYFCLVDIDKSIDEAVEAWEKRDYWKKAEEFRYKWRWAGYLAAELKQVILKDEWEKLPALMAQLIPHFADIKINKFTRKADTWLGSYQRLKQENR